ncbi:MAG: hypothetical protein M2R45_03881 [Verrucomicrobia subdivision 3 bacterium]|nr:hypothetical protein [Limisphaerales bacterium]MCS1412585.1 hypothetical protein [Limisphaerales bacterium]
MKTLIVSLSLFAVILAYVAFRPSDGTSPASPALTEQNAGSPETTSTARDGGRRQAATAADWAAVHAIAEEYAEEVASAVAQRDELKASEYYRPNWGSTDPNSEWAIKKNEVVGGVYRIEKTIRDLEREQWAKMSAYLSPYELRQYKLEYSQSAKDLRVETAWFEPSESEFLALFQDKWIKADFLDENFDGNIADMHMTTWRGREKIMKIKREATRERRSWASVQPEIDQLTADDEEVRLSQERRQLSRASGVMTVLSNARWREYQYGPDHQWERELDEKMFHAKELHRNGQITAEQVNQAIIDNIDAKLKYYDGEGLAE